MQSKNLCIALFVFGCSLSVNGQSANQSIQNIKSQFTKGETMVSEILGNASLMTLHSLTPFREILRDNAKAEKIKIVTDEEPGKKILVQGIITNQEGVAEAGKLIYIYQTSGKGWYADSAAHVAENEGDWKHARLFGYLKTNSKGEFAFNTIKPQGYPKRLNRNRVRML